MSRFLTGFIPLLLVWAFVGWSYYVYAIVYLLPMVLKVDLISIVWFSIYHLFLTLFTICYLRVTFGNPGSLPENLKVKKNISFVGYFHYFFVYVYVVEIRLLKEKENFILTNQHQEPFKERQKTQKERMVHKKEFV